MHGRNALWAILPCIFAACISFGNEPDPDTVFDTRLKPIFDSPNPSSCVQCHLSAVDLKDYILPSSRETFLALRAQGLIDPARPLDSKILQLISMGDSDPDGLARRVHAKNRKAEYEAFSRWIVACCEDRELLAVDVTSVQRDARPVHSDEVIRHTRKDRVLDSFVRNVWSQRMRCFPCHTPEELDDSNPQHQKPIERHRGFVKAYGTRMNIFKASPSETLRSLTASSGKRHADRSPLINIQEPAMSLLLQKPIAKLPPKDADGNFDKPSSRVPVSHMGGIKMHEGDQSYKAWLHWLQDYAASVSGEYESVSELPEDNWYPTQHVLRVKGIPSAWPNLSKVQLFVHRWDKASQRFADSPVAFTQSLVTPRKIVNGSLFVLAKPEERSRLDPTGMRLEPGRIQLRIYLDHEQILEESPTSLLNDRNPDATAVLEAQFGIGFKHADTVDSIEVK